MHTVDVIIAGLGVTGSATAYRLAANGLRVLGLDRWSPPHTAGSSHGGSRIIREAYFEGAAYVPLVRRAYDLWHELEQEHGERLFVQTGGMTIGRPAGPMVSSARQSADEYTVAYDELSSREVARRFPEFRLDDDMVGILEHRAGVLLPEACVEAQLAQARRHGAVLQCDEAVVDWSAGPLGVTVRTTRGSYAADSLVLAAGAWLPHLLGPLDLGLSVERQVMHWFAPAPPFDLGGAAHSPVTIWEYEPDRAFYTIPDMGDGVKAAFHHAGARTDAESVERSVSGDEVAAVEQIVARHVPGLLPTALRSATCLYTNTPDEHFIIDRHPAHDRVIIASACSGHGFKFGPAVGEMIAQLVTTPSAAPPALFSARRPRPSA